MPGPGCATLVHMVLHTGKVRVSDAELRLVRRGKEEAKRGVDGRAAFERLRTGWSIGT